MNKNLNYIISLIADVAQSKLVIKSLQDIAKASSDVNSHTSKGVKHMGDFERAMRRAITVVPVWMAFRAVLRGTMSTIGEGVKFIEDLDTAMAKNRMVIQGFSGDMKKATDAVEQTTRALSLMTGKSVKEVGDVFYKVAERGLDFQTALQSMQPIVKTSVSMMTDAGEVARVLAMTYDLLGNSMDKNLSPMEKFERLGGLISSLWKSNTFEADEFMSALNNSVTTFSNYNIKAENAIALLATLQQAGLQGARAGTAVSKLFADLTTKTDKLTEVLNIKIEPGVKIDSWQLLLKTLDALKAKGSQTQAQFQALVDVFTKRGLQGVLPLLGDPEKFSSNINEAIRSTEELIKIQDELYQIQIGRMTTQKNIFYNLRNEMVNAFVMGATGTDDIAKGMIKVNAYMKEGIKFAYILGSSLKEAGRVLQTLFQNVPMPEEQRYGAKRAFTGMAGTAIGGLLGYSKGGATGGVIGGVAGGVAGFAGYDIGWLLTEEGQKYASAYKTLQKEMEKNIKAPFDKEAEKIMSELASGYAKGIMKPEDLMKEISFYTGSENKESWDIVRKLNEKKVSGDDMWSIEKASKNADDLVSKLGELGKIEDNTEDASRRKLELEKQLNDILGDQEVKSSKITDEFRNQIRTMADKNKNMLSELDGISQYEIKMNELTDLITRYVEQYNKAQSGTSNGLVETQNSLNILKDIYLNKEEAIIKLTEQGIINEKQAKEIMTQLNGVLEERVALIQKYGSEFKSTFQEGLTSFFKNESTVNDFVDNLKGKLVDMWAESYSTNLTNVIFKSTGLGSMVGEFFGGMQNPITKAHLDGISQGAKILKNTYAEINGGVAGTTSGSLPSWLPFNKTLSSSAGGLFGNNSWGSLLGNFGMGYLSGSRSTSGGNSWLTGGLSGLSALSSMIPGWGMIASVGLGFLSNIASMKSETHQTETTTNTVASKIDVTNKELKVLNRNMSGLRNDLTYILRESTYFSEKNNLADEFSLNARRGLS